MPTNKNTNQTKKIFLKTFFIIKKHKNHQETNSTAKL